MLTTTAIHILAQDIGDVAPAVPTAEIGDKISMLLGWVVWGAIIYLVGGLTYAASSLGFQKRYGNSDGGSSIVWHLLGAVVVGSAAQLVNTLAF